MYKRKAHILFLCMDNDSRPQMAEAYANTLGHDWLEAQSAGIDVSIKNPRAVAVMAEDGIDMSAQVSSVITDEMMQWADLLVSFSAQVEEPSLVLPAHVRRKYWPVDDPAKATGSDDEIIQAFRYTRDEIKRRVNSMINGMRMMSKSS